MVNAIHGFLMSSYIPLFLVIHEMTRYWLSQKWHFTVLVKAQVIRLPDSFMDAITMHCAELSKISNNHRVTIRLVPLGRTKRFVGVIYVSVARWPSLFWRVMGALLLVICFISTIIYMCPMELMWLVCCSWCAPVNWAQSRHKSDESTEDQEFGCRWQDSEGNPESETVSSSTHN